MKYIFNISHTEKNKHILLVKDENKYICGL